MAFSVAKQVVLQGPHGQWLPEDQQVVSGRDFVKLKKWSFGVVKFFTGQSLSFDKKRSSGTVDRAIWTEILAARQEKGDALVQDAMKTVSDSDEEAEPRPSAKKKPRLCRTQSKHAHLVDGILQITVRGHDFAVLYEGMGKAEFWMEALPENIEFFHSELQKDEPKNRKAKAKKKTKAPAARRAGEEGSGSD